MNSILRFIVKSEEEFKKSSFLHNLVIIFSFLIFSYLCIALLISTHNVAFIGDLHFHFSRINELYANMKQGIFLPQFANTYFSGVGSAVMTVYPYLTLLPFAILNCFIKNPIIIYYIFLYSCFFMGMVFAYFSSFGYNRNRKISYIFAILYSMLSNNLFWQHDLGMQLAIVFLPLAIFGFLSFIKYNRWIELSVGMGLLFSHIISFVLVLVVLMFWFLMNISKLTSKHILSFLKCAITFLLFTAIYWVPLITLLINNRLFFPEPWHDRVGTSGNRILLDAISPMNYISDHQFVHFTVNVVALIGLFLGIRYFRSFNRLDKQIYIIAVFLVFVYSFLFPWQLFQTLIQIIQTPGRIYIVPQLLLDYLFAIIIVKDIHFNKARFFNKISVKIILILMCFCSFQMMIQYQHINQNIDHKESSEQVEKLINMPTMANKMGNSDYYPFSTVKNHMNHYINNHKSLNINRVNFENKGNGVLYYNHAKNLQKMVVPYLFYHAVDYKVTINGQKVRTSSNKKGLMTVASLNELSGYKLPQKGQIKISDAFRWEKIFGELSFLLALISYAFEYFYHMSFVKSHE